MSHDDEPELSCAEQRAKAIAPVLASINLKAIPKYASRVRQQYQYPNCHECSAATIGCVVLSPPLSGSYHVVFQLEFTDGLRWIIKIPVTGYPGPYNEIAARALKAEALTMRLLKRETTIPIPEVYSFDASIDNELNCPYILMEFIHGTKLSAGWFKPSSPLVSIEQFRTNALKDIAAAMVQLNKFTYNQSGSLVFDENGNVTGMGPTKVVDGPAWSESLDNDDCNDSSSFFENGPFGDPRLCFLSALERHAEPDMAVSGAKFDKGAKALLRLLINWVPFENNPKDSRFVLKHPDLDTQNILVSEDGHLCGIIDWDGVVAAPRYTGCEQYPLWLTCDWNPFQYDYQGPDPDDPQHSPEELAYYRSMYAGFMDLYLAKEESKSSIQTKQGTTSTESCFATPSHFTRGSLLVQSLELASIQPIFTENIIDKLFELIEGITASKSDDSGLEDDVDGTSIWESGSAGTESASDKSDSDEEKASAMVHHNGSRDTMAHQSVTEEEDNNDFNSSLLMETTMITSDQVHHDKEDDAVDHQSFNDGVDDDLSSVSSQLSGSSQDRSSLRLLAYYLRGTLWHLDSIFHKLSLRKSEMPLHQIENTNCHGASTDPEAEARKIDKHLGFDIGQKLQDVRDIFREHGDSLLRSVATFADNSKAKVFPSRSKHYCLDGTDKFSCEFHRSDSEATLKLVNGDIEKCDAVDLASAASNSTPKTFLDKNPRSDSGETLKVVDGDIEMCDADESTSKISFFKTVLCGNSPAARIKVQQGDIKEKPPLAEIYLDPIGDNDPEARRAIVDVVDTSTDLIQEDGGAVVDVVDTSTDLIQEDGGAVVDVVDTSTDLIQEDGGAVVDTADTSEDINQEDDIDQSVQVGQEGTGDDVNSYEDSGLFTLWDIAHLLADGTLDEDRMERLKNGFFALLASLEDETAVPTMGADTGTA